MHLLVGWLFFIFLMSFFEDLELLYYLLFSCIMFYATYLYNQSNPIKILPRIVILLLLLPNGIIWYVAFVYNDFLSLTPISYEYFIGLSLLYIYIMAYIFLSTKPQQLLTKNVFKITLNKQCVNRNNLLTDVFINF